MLTIRNKAALALQVISLFFLVPGLMYPMLALNMEGKISSNMGRFGMTILEKNSSILATVSELYENDLVLVAFLIFLFSVLVPVIKGLLVVTALLTRNLSRSKKIVAFVSAVGKWSMADVFVVAIFLAYLSTRGQPAQSSHSLKVFGFNLDLTVELITRSQPGTGFYLFLSYCLISLVAIQLIRIPESLKKQGAGSGE